MNHINEYAEGLDMDTLPWWLHPDALAEGAALHTYMGQNYLVCDFETTGIDFGSALNKDNRLLNVAWRRGVDSSVSFDWGSEFEQQRFKEAVREIIDNRGVFVAHNAKFELQWMKRMGIDIGSFLVYDTILGDYVLLGNRQNLRLNLGAVVKRWGGKGKEGTIDALMSAGVCPSDQPPALLKARVKLDVHQTEQVFLRQRKRLLDTNRLPVLLTRCIFTPVLADMEMRGLSLDHDAVYNEYNRACKDYALAVQDFEEFTGGVNHRSTSQMAHYLYGTGKHTVKTAVLTPGGKPKMKAGEPVYDIKPAGLGFKELRRHGKLWRNKPSKQFPDGAPRTDTDTIDKLKATTQKQRKFVTLRARTNLLFAELSKTLEFFKGVVDEYEGHFYGEFHQTKTKTHRLSSRGKKLFITQFDKEKSVQFQNFKRSFKPLIGTKDPDNVVLEIDGSGLEFRTAVFLGDDTQGKQDIRDDEDVHAVTASVINACPQSDVTKEMRSEAKPHTFKPLYGGESGTEDEVRYYEHFKAKYHELADVQQSWCYDVLQNKMLITPWGMRYYWPHTRMNPRSGYISNTTNIKNYPVQAFATAEIIPIAIVYMWHRMRANKLKSFMNNTVHDSVIIEAIPAELDALKGLGLQTFTLDVYQFLQSVYNIAFDVPLGAGFTIGSTWASKDSTEWEINVEADGSYWEKGTRKNA